MATDGTEEVPKFNAPVIQDNATGWGPCEMADQFMNMPYQPFSKGDRLGKVNFKHLDSIWARNNLFPFSLDRFPTGRELHSKIRSTPVSQTINSAIFLIKKLV